MFKKLLFTSTLVCLCSEQGLAEGGVQAACEFDSEDFRSGQRSTVVPFFLELVPGDSSLSEKDLIEIDGKDFVARIYGSEEEDRFTLSLEIRSADGTLLPRAASSFYVDGRRHLLALIEGTNLLRFKCRASSN